MRILLALLGFAAVVFGVVLFVDYAAPAWPGSLATLAWIGGGPLVNDVVFAPVAGVAGLLLARVLPASWRAPVQVGAVVTAVLGVVAFPLLWRAYGVPPQPGLHDGNTWLGLLVTLAVVWIAVLVAAVVRAGWARRRPDCEIRPHTRR